jgi:large subunit ribosomal protein L30
MPARLRVTLVKSPVSHTARTRGTVRALGLHRIGESVEINDTPEMRGMTRAVAFLLRTEPVEAAVDAPATAQPTRDEAAPVEPASDDAASVEAAAASEPSRPARRSTAKKEATE